MGDVITPTTAMEAFLLNPTQPNDRYTESQSLTLKTRQSSDQLASHPSKSTPRQSIESFSDPRSKHFTGNATTPTKKLSHPPTAIQTASPQPQVARSSK